ncbi:MAG: hypothetical protein MR302_03315, partial [Lachnospiraceae bacterium]|nr:hypothetical protein [Lachnospiraceae bacterium]
VIRMSLENRKLFIDIKNRFAYNNTRRKACFSSGLTLESDMLVNHVIDRWRTTLKSDIFTNTQLVVGRQH